MVQLRRNIPCVHLSSSYTIVLHLNYTSRLHLWVVFIHEEPGYHYAIVNKVTRKQNPYDCPATYQISVQGWIDPTWSNRLDGMTISLVTADADSPITTLVGEVSDQAALAGVLNTLYELHLVVLSVKCLNMVSTCRLPANNTP